ncbi:hypothetical protein D0Z08_10125 [Nocardioides immobilis]|uniref:Uncharacterized protein n=1 Tax=Nocardioides immobilis TaxID=2049295 RepID=A0A417Y387_9ACTN|nr:hypothetical protein D0Z08_10125 [Nocardioides immobilis]
MTAVQQRVSLALLDPGREQFVVELFCDLAALSQEGQCSVELAETDRQVARREQPVPTAAGGSGREVQCPHQIQQSLLEMAGVPPGPERCRDVQSGVGLSRMAEAELDGGADVVVLPAQPEVPLALVRGEVLPVEPVGQAPVVVPVPEVDRVDLRRRQPSSAVLADRLQHPVPGVSVLHVVLADDDRLADQPGQQLEHVFAGHAVARTDLLGRLQVEPAREDRQARPQQLLLGRAEVEAPSDCRVERLMSGRAGAAPSREQLEAVLQPVQDLRRRQCSQPDRGELEGERQPVQPLAQLDDRPPVLLGDLELGIHRPSPLHEESHRLIVRSLADGHRGILRDGQRWHREDLFALDIEHVPTGRQHPKAWCLSKQLAHHDRAGLGQMLAAVEHDKQLLLLQVIGQVGQRVSGHVT